MKYNHIVPGIFLERPNRFIAYVEIAGRKETVHVKNTGRCRELLQPGALVYLEKSDNPARKTQYDLVAVQKGNLLINMDSQAPNKVVEEWLRAGELFSDVVTVRPETTYGNSRFDFYVETSTERIFIEVKGVTLEENGVVRFPDAPSERAVKHVEELVQAYRDGYQVYVLFVIQMEEAKFFTPNKDTHPAFAQALEEAAKQGVRVLAYSCSVTPDSLQIKSPVLVKLGEKKSFGINLPPLKRNLRIGELKEVPNPLLAWYDNNRRILPWREDPKPYRVWVSEIMLQQTRVEAVKPYFERFMKSLPDIEALAAAEEEVLLKLWEGLGYYNRVRNLQKAAIHIMEDYDGHMPDTYEELLKLKGIGSYTAGAVASIAFKRPVPAVDGNVLRVISRIRADERLITDAKVKSAVEEDLKLVMPIDRPGDFNQAMMEIGACVCIPNGEPHCRECPLQEICKAHAEGCELQYPKKAAKKQRRIEEKTILVIRDENKAALKKRGDKGLLAGMYEFPSMEGYKTAEEVTAYLSANGIRTLRIQPLEEAKHIFTHKEWRMKGYMVRVDELAPKELTEITKDWLFIEPRQTEEKYPIPAAFAAYTRYLNIKLGNEKYENPERG
ncbi:MAG: DNA/RNA nuclease SfsA [Lachnospiraceae bacterium]|nr:DNA/RNA nuclease SfsA [Lachnospiraceae bacterium]